MGKGYVEWKDIFAEFKARGTRPIYIYIGARQFMVEKEMRNLGRPNH